MTMMQRSANPSGDHTASAARKISCGIRFEDVTVAYHRTVVLDSFSLTVEPGEVMALLGPSGSGKTTALRSVAGFVRPVSGRVFVNDREVTRLPPYARGVGMVVQQYALFPHMKVRENVAFGLKAQKADRKLIPDRVRDALEMVGMGGFADRYPRELSGGQQQRAAIARALAIRPEVLLLDEPLSALDAQMRTGMLAEIARLHRELPDLSILYVTHDQVEALTLADRIAVMSEAKLVEVGRTRELYERPTRHFTAGFLGNSNLLPVVVERCDPASGWSMVRFGEQSLRVQSRGEHQVGTSATVCVHPHCLEPVDSAAVDNVLTGTVTDVQWRGNAYRVSLSAHDTQIRVDAGMRKPPQIGQDLSVRVETQDAVLLSETADG